MHKGQATWYASNDLDQGRIFLWNGSGVNEIADDATGVAPMIHDGWVTWSHWDGDDSEIFLWDGSGVIQLTDNAADDSNPQIHSGQVMWSGWDGADAEIFLRDSSGGVIQFANPGYSFDDYEFPNLNDGQIVWSGGAGINEIFLGDSRPYDVRNLHFTSAAELGWNRAMACSPVAYDVIRGDVANLAVSGEEIDLGPVVSIESDSPDLAAADGATPAPGVAWFYIARGTQYGGYGRSSTGASRHPSGGDCR